MTGRTHDLAAFTALSLVILNTPLPPISLATGLCALGANFIGGLAPDLDQPTADLWRRLPAGSVIGRLVSPIMGSHRFISHSILGVVLFGFVLNALLKWMGTFVLVDMGLVWSAFMIGFVSHLIMDTLTRDGVPWFFPIPVRLGFPPISALRMKTGGYLEKYVVFPGLLIFNGYWFSHHYHFYVEFLRRFF
ncbi:MAG: metal-dependent hydrolase [Candidatus Curtissbacteria bacterium]|nr:metal-dependent hydrolase [Candidatus Curtissbacteria bacterium]